MNYLDFQQKSSSEKITLAILESSRRLVGFTYSSNIYQLTNFDGILTSLSSESNELQAAESLAQCKTNANLYYNDRINKILYINSLTNPNSKYIVATFQLFFSSSPINLPCDLNEGPVVSWDPSIKSTSQFGVEMDTVSQITQAIDGDGKLSLYNNQKFWINRYGKFNFDNQRCFIFSYSRNLPLSEVKVLFSGVVQKQSYSDSEISFSLIQSTRELKGSFPLNTYNDFLNYTNEVGYTNGYFTIPDEDYNNFVRNVYGVLDGFVPYNVSSIDDKKGIFLSNNCTSQSGYAFLYLNFISSDGTYSTVSSINLYPQTAPLKVGMVLTSDKLDTKDNILNLVSSIVYQDSKNCTFTTRIPQQDFIDHPYPYVKAGFNSITVNGVYNLSSKVFAGDTLVYNNSTYTVLAVAETSTPDIGTIYVNELIIDQINGKINFIPSSPRRNNNRRWLISANDLSPVALYTNKESTLKYLPVLSTDGLVAGSEIKLLIGANQFKYTIESLTPNSIRVAETLPYVIPAGTQIIQSIISNFKIVRDQSESPIIDNLQYIRDYDFYKVGNYTLLELKNSFETNVYPQQLSDYSLTLMVFPTASLFGYKYILGNWPQGKDKPALTDIFTLGANITNLNNSFSSTVLDIQDEYIVLKDNIAGVATGIGASFNFLIDSYALDPSKDLLSFTLVGAKETQTHSGIMKSVLHSAGFSDNDLNLDTFKKSAELAPQRVSLTIPDTASENSAPDFKDVIDKINKSAISILVQDENLNFSYELLEPNKSNSKVILNKEDLISIKVETNSENLFNTIKINYGYKNYRLLNKGAGNESVSVNSDYAQYVLGISNMEKEFDTLLYSKADAIIFAKRWQLLLESSTNIFTILTKMQGSNLKVNDTIEINDPHMFNRKNSESGKRILIVQSVKKSGFDVEIMAVDLSNTIERVAAISNNLNTYAESTEDEQMASGFITDENGLINNDQNSFGLNLTW